MTEQQFKDLRIGDEVTVNTVHCKVVEVYPFQQIIMAKGNATITKVMPFRYENCELVLKDELVEYLSSLPIIIDKQDIADKIRSIVRKEMIDSLKFPSYDEWRSNFYDWFIEETKKLNR